MTAWENTTPVMPSPLASPVLTHETMEAIEQHQNTCQGTERLLNLTINHLPDEVLLEIFDSYRRGIRSYKRTENFVWFNLLPVCRKWRGIIFSSACRLDLGITVGPEKPVHIKTILSGAWPIFIGYTHMYGQMFGSALWRLHAALRHHDRVREIAFEGASANFDNLFRATNRPFPVLEGLDLQCTSGDEPRFPGTFLRGPDLPILRLRRLKLYRVSLAIISRFLSSAVSLTDLDLNLSSYATFSSETTLLACLQGLSCLRRLVLSIPSIPIDSQLQPLSPKDIVRLSKLTDFRYCGPGVLLGILVAGLSAPSLLDFDMNLHFTIWSPTMIVHLSRFIDEIEEYYHAVNVEFQNHNFCLSLLTQMAIESKLTRSFSTVTNLEESGSLISNINIIDSGEDVVAERNLKRGWSLLMYSDWGVEIIPWRRFLQRFTNVKVLRTGRAKHNCIAAIARSLLQDYEGPDDCLAFLPSLEVIEIEKNSIFEARRGTEPATFEPFLSARQKAGRPVCILWPIVG